MKIIGITGNYGCGKSALSTIFEMAGCKIINLDRLGHHILKKNKFKKKLIKQFGKYILDNEEISRNKLRKIVFYNPEYLIKLNKIIDPELKLKLKKEIDKYKKKNYRAIVVDAALIFELKIENLMDVIITVSTLKIISYLRILKNKKISYTEFKNIYNSQMPLKEKKRKSNLLIHNNLPIKYSLKKIKKTIEKILK